MGASLNGARRSARRDGGGRGAPEEPLPVVAFRAKNARVPERDAPTKAGARASPDGDDRENGVAARPRRVR